MNPIIQKDAESIVENESKKGEIQEINFENNNQKENFDSLPNNDYCKTLRGNTIEKKILFVDLL